MVLLSWPSLLLLGCLQTSIARKYEIMSAVRNLYAVGLRTSTVKRTLYKEVFGKTNDPT